MKEKTVNELEFVIKRHLTRDNKNCKEFNNKRDEYTNDFWYWELMQERITFSHLMEFANKILGRREVNKLCRKYNIENKY